MKYSIDITTELTAFNNIQKVFFINVFGDFAVNKIFEFIRLGKIINRDNIPDAALIKRFNNVAADESGSAGNDISHIRFSFKKIIKVKHWSGAQAKKTCKTALILEFAILSQGENYKAANNSSRVTVAVPSLPTTMPAARLAMRMASGMLTPAASIKPRVAITVSPAPETS